MMIKKIAAGLIFLFSISGLRAQIKFSGNPGLINRSIDALLSIRVSNAGSTSLPGMLTISVTEENTGKSVVTLRFDKIILVPGMTSLSKYKDRSLSIFYENELSQIARSIGAMAPGEYMICCQFEPEDKRLVLADGQHCFINSVMPRNPLLLVSPVDSICHRRPPFNWQGRKTAASGTSFTILCAPIKKGQSAQEALQNNPHVVNQSVFQQVSQLSYPAGSPPLKEGEKYAWQVVETSGRNILNTSDIGEFIVGCEIPLEQGLESFVEVKPVYTGKKHYFTSSINFSFNNPYSAKALNYSVTHVASNKKLANLPPLKMTSGLNKVLLASAELKGLEKGQEYKIELHNLGSTTHYINFIIKE